MIPTRAALGTARRGTGGRLVALGVLAAVIGFLGLIGYRLLNPPGGASPGAPGVNAFGREVSVERGPAPSFELEGFDGAPIALDGLRGNVVVLNFWSSWCRPCADEVPVLEAAVRRYAGRGVQFVGANVWTVEQDARVFLEEHGVTYPNGRTDAALAARYGLTGIPETFIIDRDGTLARRWNGPLSERELSTLIDPLLVPSVGAGQHGGVSR